MARELFRSRPKAVEFDIAGLLSDLGGKSGLLCLSETTWELAYNLVLFYGYWRSRYYYRDPATGEAQTLTDEEYDQITDLVDLAIEELQMPGCDEITIALNNLTVAVSGLGTNGGSGCCPAAYGALPEDAVDPGDQSNQIPPAGFATWAEYTDYKCRAANRIADEWTQTVRNMATLGGIGSVIGAAALALFIQTSLLSGILVGIMALGFSAASAAAIIIGLLITLIVGNAAQFAFFDDLADDLDTNHADFVCDIFTATSVAVAKNRIGLFTLAYANASEPFNSTLTDLISNLFNDNLLNILFVEDPETAEYVGTVDCDACSFYPAGQLLLTTTSTPFNVVLVGQHDPQWYESPASPGDINFDTDGWCTSTPRGAGTYRTLAIEFPNPYYGGTAPGPQQIRFGFTLRNMALQSPNIGVGWGTKTAITRGPGYSSNAFRASTAGVDDLDSYEEFTATFNTTGEYCSLSMQLYYDAGYNNALPGCLRKVDVNNIT